MSTDGGSVWTEIDSYFDNGADLVIDPFDENTLWAGGSALDSTGTSYIFSVVKTDDAGTSWDRFDIGEEEGTLFTLAINPRNTDIVYAGGHESGNSVIYKTDDGGGSWSKLVVTGLTGYVYDIVVDPFSPQIMFAATYSGVFISLDYGNTWTQCDPGFGGAQVLLLTRATDDIPTLFAGTENNGVWYSPDGGNNWYEMNTGLDDDYVGCLALDDGNYLLAGTDAYASYRWNILTGVSGAASQAVGVLNLTIAPNPAFNSVSVNYDLSIPGDVKIAVYDLQGRIVANIYSGYRTSGSYSESWTPLDEQGNRLGTGIYVCRLHAGDEIETRKLVLF